MSITPAPWNIFYYRDKDHVEVDFVLENHDRKIIGIEVKASNTAFNQDFRGLRKLASMVGNDWITGIVLYDGEHVLPQNEMLPKTYPNSGVIASKPCYQSKEK